MRRLRAVLIGVLAWQAAASAAPAGALIVCVAEDGRAALEFAVPGTWHCDDRRCEQASVGDPHACRDIPVLASASAALQPAAREVAAPVQCLGACLPAGMIASANGPAALAGATRDGADAVRHRRSTVLRC